MEKYLRLLTPKTTNYDAIGGGNFGALTREDVLTGISYAKLSPLQDVLLNLRLKSTVTEQDLQLATAVISSLLEDQEQTVLYMALLETFAVAADYKPSERKRAVIMGLSRMKIQRGVGNKIDAFKAIMRNELDKAFNKIKTKIE